MAKLQKRSSVRTKLISVMMLICIVPLAISLVISYTNSMNQALTDAKIIGLKQVEIIDDGLSAIINQNMLILESIAHSPHTKKFMIDEQNRDSEEMKQYLLKINKQSGDSNDIVLTDATGQQVLRTSGNLVNIGDREYFLETMKGTATISKVLTSKATGSRIIVLAVPIIDDNNVVLGIVQKSYDLTFLHSFLTSYVDATVEQECFIVDSAADLIAHSNYEISVDDEVQNFKDFEFFVSKIESGNYLTLYGGKKFIMSYIKDSTTGWTVVTAINYHKTVSSSEKSATISVIIGVVMLVFAIILSLIMANSFTSPLKELNIAIGNLAEGSFSPIERYLDRTDEFGYMVERTNTVITTLDGIITNIKKSTNEVNASSDELAQTANQISQTAESVATTVQEIASGATQQSDEIQSITENAESISAATAKVQGGTNELTDLATNMQEASNNSAESLSELQKSSQKMSDSITQISAQIGSTGESVDNINDKVEEIASIAAQTNLLSLNASIEAARAGEAGRGFAVVADEISQLADNSRNLANGIREEMDILLSKSREAVAMAAEVQKENNNQQKVIDNTVASVNDILGDISATAEKVKSIDTEVAACVASNNTVSEAMSSLSAISEENAASSETTGAAVEELSATVTTLAESADSLKVIADKLNSDMSFFK